MKQYPILLLAALLAASCQQEITPEGPAVTPDGQTTFSVGYASSKVAVGDKVGAQYQAVWQTGDALIVKTADGTTELGTATLTSGAGTNAGVFTMPGTVTDGTSVKLYFNGGDITSTLTKASTDKTVLTSAVSGAVTVTGGSADGVEMVHSVALVKVSVASTTLAGAAVKAVIFRSEGTVIAGTDDYVKVTLSDTPTLGATAQEFWFAVNPVDLSDKEVDVAFCLSTESEDYTLPVAFKGKNMVAGTAYSFTLPALDDSQCAKWYAPHDTRLMAGEGYAYGEANTYTIQYKEATYSGGTLDADPNIPSEVYVDYRVRGDFLKVVNPTGATFAWLSHNGTSNYNIQYSGYVATNPNSFTFADTPADYKVKVTNTGSYAGAPLLTMSKGGKVLWTWTFWNISADGTRLQSVAVGTTGESVANMDLGQNTTQFTTWSASSSKPELNFRCNFYYQWGRPTPVFWSSWPTNNLYTTSGWAIKVIEGPVTIAESIQNPGTLILNPTKAAGTSSTETGAVRLMKWEDGTNAGDLWGGGVKDTDASVKSIYDPCPKGWRVMTKTVGAAVLAGTKTADITKAGAYCITSSASGDVTWSIPGRYEDYIANNGRVATQGMSNAGTSKNQGARWTNFSGGAGAKQASAMYIDAGTMTNTKISTFNKASGCSVRCMIDSDNR